MYEPPIRRIPERILPRVKRNAMVKRRIEKAHGLIESISAAMPTKGSIHFPPFDQFHKSSVPFEPKRKNRINTARITAKTINAINLEFINLRLNQRFYFQVNSRAVTRFYRDHSANRPDSRRPVRRGVKLNRNYRLFVRGHGLAHFWHKTMPGHAVRTALVSVFYERGFGAHARRINTCNFHGFGRRVPDFEFMAHFARGH